MIKNRRYIQTNVQNQPKTWMHSSYELTKEKFLLNQFYDVAIYNF